MRTIPGASGTAPGASGTAPGASGTAPGASGTAPQRPIGPRSTPVRSLLVWGIALLMLSFLSVAQAGKSKVPPAVQDALTHAVDDRVGTIRALEQAAASGNPSDAAWARVHLGEQLRLSGDTTEARRWFIDAGRADVPQVTAIAELGMALLDAARGPDSSTLTVLRQAKEAAVPASQNADRYAWLAVNAAGGGGGDLGTYARQALEHAAADPEQTARIKAMLAGVGYGAATGATAAGPTTTTAPAPVDPARALQSAVDAWASGDAAGARELAQQALMAADPRLSSEARALIQTMDSPACNAQRIGVLLPQSGRFATVGEQVKVALLDGWAMVAPVDQLVFVDSGGTPETAVAALRALVTEQQVIAVIGPLLSDETLPVVQAADELGVPIITLSQVIEDASAWAWAFQAWVTPRQQIAALLDHAMNDQHLRRFAIYAPSSSYGSHAADEFTAQVQARGGTIVVRVDYAEDLKTHGDAVLPLRLPDPDPARPEPWYDAIFVPDNARGAAAAVNAMTFHEISVGEFRAQSRAAVPLLGLSGWNRYELIGTGGPGIQGGRFTDLYSGPPPASTGLLWTPRDPWQDFTTRFTTATTRTPSSIEAMASDAGQVVARALKLNPADRFAFRAALLMVKPGGTVSEVRGFDASSRVLLRRITVFQIRSSGFAPFDLP